MRRPVALVGAFERDNFGDLLFLELTRQGLIDRPTLATAPTSADMSKFGVEPGEVHQYWSLLDSGEVDAVWVVGGEVGGTSLEIALRMSGSDDKIGSIRRGASPYLPRPSAFPRSAGIPLIVNSVGLSGLNGLRGARRIEAIAALQEADFVGVRDAPSSALLTANRIPHVLAPDLVQTLPQTTPLSPPELAGAGSYSLFQMKAKWVQAIGIADLVEAIARSRLVETDRLVLLPAGLATGHDSIETYERIRRALQTAAPTVDVEIFDDVRPFKKARLVAHSELFVGTSLHGHIIASAYGVPRVAMLTAKVHSYAQTWDDPSPTMVTVDALASATADAVQVGGTADDRTRGMELARLAMAGFDAAGAGLRAVEGADRTVARERHAREVSRRLASPQVRFTDFASSVHRRLRFSAAR